MNNMKKPLSIKVNNPDPFDRINTFTEYIMANHSGIERDTTYKVSGSEMLEILRNAMYYAHANGRIRERSLHNGN